MTPMPPTRARAACLPLALAALLLALALALAACAEDEPTEEADDDADAEVDEDAEADEDAEPDDAEDAEAEEPRELTLLTHDSFNVSEDVLASFTEETGIEVSVVPSGDAGTALNQAILTKDAPQGDLLFGVDNTFLSRALDEDLFVPYTSPRLDDVDEDLILDDEHRATPIDYGDVCLNYDRAWFDERDVDVPSDLDDLTDEAYDGLLAVTNPATSSPGLAFLLATIERFGDGEHLAFWEDLSERDVVVTDGWSEAYYDEFSGTGGGDRPLVVSYASSPPAEVISADPQPDEAPTGVIEESCFRQIEHVGILAGTDAEAEAQELVDFMLDVPFQEDMPLNMFVFPVNERAELPEAYLEHTVVPSDPFEIDYAEIGEQREEWIDEWTATVLR
ncbi:MAG: thiamine ABC transporter substrate-binding protein [Egibacteraceae bacterium]